MKDQPLLTPHQMGDIQLPNRVIMAPMTRSRATNKANAPTEDLHVAYYTQRAAQPTRQMLLPKIYTSPITPNVQQQD